MTVGFLFPGQGSQHPGMLHELPKHPQVAITLREASEVIGHDILELDEEKALESTVSTQMAIYTAGVAVARSLIAEGVVPDVVAGLSVGAFAAATACGALMFRDGLRLVHLRASLMEEKFPTGYGLAAIVGLDEAQVSAVVAVCSAPAHPVFIANLNAPRQIVVAGSILGLDKVVDLALRTAGCTKAERLQIAIPSHCPLLESVAEKLVAAMRTLEPKVLTISYMTDLRARPTRVFERIREDISTNIAHPVRWHDATEVMVGMGVTLFIEANPGRVLSNLIAAAFPDVTAIAVAFNPFDEICDRARKVRKSAEMFG